MIDVSIIIVNYNTLKLTKECIESVQRHTKDIRYEIIVIDNCSKDGSKDFFSNFSGISYIYSNSNDGFGRANNKGIKYAKGRNILFLNSDTILLNNSVKILSDFLDSNAKVGACGGNLYYEDMSPNTSYFLSFPSLGSEIDSLLFDRLSNWTGKRRESFNFGESPKKVAYISGADLMIKKSILEECGSFDPDFFMYYEETELCYRISKAGYRIMSVPKSKIIHLTGKSQTRKSRVPSSTYLKSKLIYINKTTTGLYRMCFTFVANLKNLSYKLFRI